MVALNETEFQDIVDAYGNTLIFTAADSSGNWWSDSAVQSSYGANDIICCGYRYDAESENYYVRNRYYSPVLGRWLTRDPIGYRGGINLYGYVESDPVGMVDPEGTKWTIVRDGKARATVEGQKGDTINSLLQTKDNHGHLVRLAADEYKKWLEPIGNSALPASATAPLKCDEKFTIPNTILASRGDIDSIAGLVWWHSTGLFGYGVIPEFISAMRQRGFKVKTNWNVSLADVKNFLASPDAYGWYFYGHGANGYVDTNFGRSGFILPSELMGSLNHRLGFLELEGCNAGVDIHRKANHAQIGWGSLVSPNGILRASAHHVGANTPWNQVPISPHYAPPLVPYHPPG